MKQLYIKKILNLIKTKNQFNVLLHFKLILFTCKNTVSNIYFRNIFQISISKVL